MKYIKVQIEFVRKVGNKEKRWAIVKTYRSKELKEKLDKWKKFPCYYGYQLVTTWDSSNNNEVEVN